MKTFTEMAEEWIRANVSTTQTEVNTPATAEPDPLADLRQPFVHWFDSQIKLSVEAVAGRTPPRWWTTLTALHADFCAWVFARDLAPPTSDQFRGLLLEVCCELSRIDDEEFVMNVALKEDMDAHERFENPPPPPAPPAPVKRYVTEPWRKK